MADPRSPFAAAAGRGERHQGRVPLLPAGKDEVVGRWWGGGGEHQLLPSRDVPEPSRPGIPREPCHDSASPPLASCSLPALVPAGVFLAKPHDRTPGRPAPPWRRARPTRPWHFSGCHEPWSHGHCPACGVPSPGGGRVALCVCHAAAVGNIPLFSLQNSLKKRGSRSLGKAEKKPSVQVGAAVPTPGSGAGR